MIEFIFIKMQKSKHVGFFVLRHLKEADGRVTFIEIFFLCLIW